MTPERMEAIVDEVITPEAEKVLTPEVVQFVKTETFQISRELTSLEVKTPEDDKRAVELGLANKSAINRLENFRKALVKPLNDHVDMINGIFKKLSEPFKQNDSLIKSKRDVYLYEQERIAKEKQRILDEQYRKEQAALEAARQKEQAKLLKQAEKKGVEPVILPPVTVLPPPPKVEIPKTVHTDLGRSTVRKVMKFEIMDASLLPREYLMPDEKKIGRRVRDREITSLPGVRIWEENSQTF